MTDHGGRGHLPRRCDGLVRRAGLPAAARRRGEARRRPGDVDRGAGDPPRAAPAHADAQRPSVRPGHPARVYDRGTCQRHGGRVPSSTDADPATARFTVGYTGVNRHLRVPSSRPSLDPRGSAGGAVRHPKRVDRLRRRVRHLRHGGAQHAHGAKERSGKHDDGGVYEGEWTGVDAQGNQYKQGVGVYTYPSGAS